MAITPQDIHHKEFRSARFGGYNEEEVDAFLDQVADELEKLIHDNNDLNQQVEMLRKRVAEFEEMQTSLQTALLAASKSAEAMKEQARQEAESMLERARQESETRLREAREQAAVIINKAKAEKERIEREIEKLMEVRGAYVDALRELASSHLRQVEEILSSPEVSPPVSTVAPGTVLPEADIEAARGGPPAEQPPEKRAGEEPSPAVLEAKAPSTPAQAAPAGETMRPEEAEEQEREQQVSRIEVAAPDLSTAGQPKVSGPQPEPEEASQRPGPEPGGGPSGHAVPAEPAGGEERAVRSSSLIDEILGVEEGENPYVEFKGFEEGEKEKGRRGRLFRREKKDRDLFWE